MKRVKIIYINKRPYTREFLDESDKFYYLFGIGHSIAWELLKINTEIEVENWRADSTIKHDLVKAVDGIVCKIFKGYETKFAGTFSISLIMELRRICKEKDTCVLVHYHGLHNIGYDIITWLIPRIPTVFTHHGGGNFQFKFIKNRFLKTYIAEKIDRFTIKKRIDHLIIQTEPERNYLLNILSSSKISRITPFGFYFDLFYPIDKSDARKKLGISPEKKVILSVARADFLKGVQHVVRVYQELKEKITGLDLFCVDVQPGDMYYNLIKESGARFTGQVLYHELPLYYSVADVLVYLPFDDESINFAGPGYVNAEALACGTPVVSSLLTHFWNDSIKEVARIPKNVEEAVKMTKEILENPPNPESCREIAFKYYNWAYVMKNHLKVYNELFQKYYNTSIS